MSEILKRRSDAGQRTGRRSPAPGVAHAFPAFKDLRTPDTDGGDADRRRDPGGSPDSRSVEPPVRMDYASFEEVRRNEYRRGYEAAQAEWTARMSDGVQSLEKAAAEIGVQLGPLSDRLSEEAFRFALAVAERVVKRAVDRDETIVLSQVKEAMARVVGVESVTIHLHPADERLVREYRADQAARGDAVREVLIEADEKIERGGCVISSAAGSVDARRSTMLAQIEAALFGNGGGIA